MDHDHHHGQHDMPPGHSMPMPGDACPMLMTWNADTSNICIISESWHVRTPRAFFLSLCVLVVVSAGYEWLRLYTKANDARIASGMEARLGGGHHHRRRASILPTTSAAGVSIADTASVASGSSNGLGTAARKARRSSRLAPMPLLIRRRTQVFRSTLYALSVFISFMLMLVAMTFNAYLIGAIVGGAGLGHYWFNRDFSRHPDDDKGLACHP
ncbi:uncharacterized protein PFL1_05596 [Pseudozyma flocculosa PF-1]|uniref:Copper transport protein n=2 Tax=Pseudozyma flocculosa TaxID=84751 RepID=A0A5C3FBT9_9BASI|nr:uncharacterized protein PFL1_05596 [Pseudozyma flocculosa PF-1]EPQ26961.1 hypothetical protein PFL1_05596 [Pseudozyma flocculosa PF-1]SPO41127.1 related to CTR2 - Protein involved in copper transport [Pseudozyma flocculosa]